MLRLIERLRAGSSSTRRGVRAVSPGPVRLRSIDAAAGSRRAEGMGSFGPVNYEIGAALDIVRSRARYLSANNGWIKNGVGNYLGDLIGTGLRPSPLGVSAAERERMVDAFAEWAVDGADYEGRTTFAALQNLIGRHLYVDGEALAILHDTRDGLQIQVLPPERLDMSKTVELDGNAGIVNGVEFDGFGRRVAYWILPGGRELETYGASASVRVDARDVIHVFESLAATQVRGLSGLAAAVLPSSDLAELTGALLVGAKVAAMIAGFIKDVNDTGNYRPDTETGDDGELTSWEPGELIRLPGGTDITFSSPQQQQRADRFVRTNLLEIAAALGLPEHYLSGDLTGANYSSLRAGLLPHRRRVSQCQALTLRPLFLDRVWRRWVALEFFAERMDAGRVRVDWIAPAWQQVDPEKAINATEKELELGLTSRSAAAEERGRSIADIDAERAADAERDPDPGANADGTQADE